jgi:hypothetical protein
MKLAPSALVLLVGGCLFDAEVPADAALSCTDDEECGEEQRCLEGICTEPDIVPPAPILDLDVDFAATTDVSFTLVFTAPRDNDPVVDRPVRYRVTLTPATGTRVSQGFPATAPAGQRERVVMDGLPKGTLFQAVVESVDVSGNVGSSNELAVETGGALCKLDPVTGLLTSGLSNLVVTRPEHLVRLFGCEAIETLVVDGRDCAVEQLVALRSLRRAVAINIAGNSLCARGLSSLDDLSALEAVDSLSIIGTQVIDLDLDVVVATRVQVQANALLETVTMSTGAAMESVFFLENPSLRAATLPALTTSDFCFFSDNDSLERVDLPALQSALFQAHNNAVLSAVLLPSLTAATQLSLENNPLLTTVTVSPAAALNQCVLHDNVALCATPFAPLCTLDDFVNNGPCP